MEQDWEEAKQQLLDAELGGGYKYISHPSYLEPRTLQSRNAPLAIGYEV